MIQYSWWFKLDLTKYSFHWKLSRKKFLCKNVMIKLRGFIYKSLWIKSNWTFCKDWIRESGFAGWHGWIRHSQFERNPWAQICKSGFYLFIVLRICADLLDLWTSLKSFENWPDSWLQFESKLTKKLNFYETLIRFLLP